MKKEALILLIAMFIAHATWAQGVVAIKTNIAYGAVALAPNLGVEIGLGERTTLDLSVGYNGWRREGECDDNRKLAHFIIEPEFRYYLCRRFNGHFFGAHAIYTAYNIGEHNLPLIFGRGSAQYRFEGKGYGAGISYGYQLLLTRRWNLELQAGLGYVRLHYDKFPSHKCATQIATENRNYIGPTRAGITLSYIIN